VAVVLKFLGFQLELFVDVEIDDAVAPVRTARSFLGELWLIVPVDCDPNHLVWVCAPITVRALEEVRIGRATVRDALCHSASGSVEVVTVDHGRAVPDRWLLCSALSEELLPGGDPGTLVAA
jgi:hypothetical protein